MYLDTTSKTLEIILGAAKTTNDCEWTADTIDTQSGTTFGPANFIGLSNGTTAVTAVAAPAASTVRKISAFTFFNADTVTTTVTVRIFDGTNRRRVLTTTLLPNQTLVFTPEAGWSILNNTGATFLQSIVNSPGVNVTSVTATDITTLTLTPGDWDCFGQVCMVNPGTVSFFVGWVGTVSATQPTAPNAGGSFNMPNSTSNMYGVTSLFRQNVSVNTTIYLGTITSYASGTMTAYGTLTARRRG